MGEPISIMPPFPVISGWRISKVADNIEVKKKEAVARIKADAKYGHEKAQKELNR